MRLFAWVSRRKGRRRARAQIRWMNDYIQARYGKPAVSHETAYRWFDKR